MDKAQTTARRDEKHLIFGFGAAYIRDFTVYIYVLFVLESALAGTCQHISPFVEIIWLMRR